MKVHHLNCGTMRPPIVGGLVCHVLLLETPDCLVLVDAGFGVKDAEARTERIGAARHLLRPAFDVEESALHQVKRLGFDPEDVRHIVLTHFDMDHVGGLADFPWAQVHLTAAESFAVRHPAVLHERMRYRPAQRSHDPKLVEHTPTQAEAWRGFAAKELREVAAGIVLIGLPGHSRGHAAVAVETAGGCLLHAGDAFFHCGQLPGDGSGAPWILRTYERLVAFDWLSVQKNHARLRELWASEDPGLTLVNSHDPQLLQRVREASQAKEPTDWDLTAPAQP